LPVLPATTEEGHSIEPVNQRFKWPLPPGGVQKKGGDRGIDGVISFSTGRGWPGARQRQERLCQLRDVVRDLKGVLEREKAEIGLHD
jgi:hypothetical protein